MKTLIFIYGTLKKGFLGHDFLIPHLKSGDVEFLGPFQVYGFKLRLGVAPFLVRSPNRKQVVKGELYEFHDPKIIKELDEGESWSYRRDRIGVDIYAYIAKPGQALDNSIDIGTIYTKGMDDYIRFLHHGLLNDPDNII